ncbi:MAG: glycosyl transferase family 2 [Bacteroidetes bacterium]|nr:glycosyl transferase family 2 [Bacteroidota bacterium]
MLKKILLQYNFRFRKTNRLKVLLSLLFFFFQEKAWRIKKNRSGIKKPVIHLYTVCWNESKIIPLIIDYYNQFIDHFYIYDNYSNDGSDALLSSYSNVSIHKFDTKGTFNDIIHQQIKNSVWKQSRGKADWVIVIDLDELLYHPNLLLILNSQANKTTIYKPMGYDMVSSEFPCLSLPITESIKTGVRTFGFDKCVLFNPYKIVNINYIAGAHECNPEGIIIYDEHTLKLLHYKYLGLNYVLERINTYRTRISKENIQNEYGLQYLDEEKITREKFHRLQQQANTVI